MKLKLRLTNEFGVPLNITAMDSIKVMFPYLENKTLEKNKFDIVDASQGIIAVELSDFELDGLNEGMKQTFWAYVIQGDEAWKFAFKNGLNVVKEGERKVIKHE